MNCCVKNIDLKNVQTCVRKKDGEIFDLPRKYSQEICLSIPIKNLGFTRRASCAPYLDCPRKTKKQKQKGGKVKSYRKNSSRKKEKKQFLYNPDDPKKSFDVYINKNPSDTISIKYTTVKDVENTIKKLEKLYKKGAYSHKRIWQVGMILKVRLEAMLKHSKTKYPNAKNVKERFNLANKYFKFLGQRTKAKQEDRYTMTFNL